MGKQHATIAGKGRFDVIQRTRIKCQERKRKKDQLEEK
jgi:hypothetical protein